MNLKTQGECRGCKKEFIAARGGLHLLQCADVWKSLRSQAKLEEGYLIRVSWSERPSMYWMFIAVPKSFSLEDLDKFLRDAWLECCYHLSSFKIGSQRYLSYTESGSLSESMEKPIEHLFFPGLKFDYVYDMGSSTELTLRVLKSLEACPQDEVTLLMQNKLPSFSCSVCKKESQIICSLCGEITCRHCSERHSCAIQEEDTYMLMPLVNSPRAGICGYTGKV